MITLVFLVYLGVNLHNEPILYGTLPSIEICQKMIKEHQDEDGDGYIDWDCLELNVIANPEKNVRFKPNYTRII